LSNNNHIIKKQIIEVEITSGQSTAVVHDKVKHIYYERILPRLDKLFSEMSPGNVVVRLDKLDFNLAGISIDRLEEEFVEKTVAAFKTKLEEKLQFNVGDSDNIELIPSYRSPAEAMLHFLEYGYFPWWHSSGDLRTLEQRIIHEPLTHSDFKRRVYALIIDHPFVLQRLVAQLSNGFLHFLISLYLPTFHSKRLYQEVFLLFSGSLGFSKSHLHELFWKLAFKNIFAGYPDTELALFRELILHYCNFQNISRSQFDALVQKQTGSYPYLESLFAQIHSPFSSGDEHPAPSGPSDPNGQEKGEMIPGQDVIDSIGTEAAAKEPLAANSNQYEKDVAKISSKKIVAENEEANAIANGKQGSDKKTPDRFKAGVDVKDKITTARSEVPVAEEKKYDIEQSFPPEFGLVEDTARSNDDSPDTKDSDTVSHVNLDPESQIPTFHSNTHKNNSSEVAGDKEQQHRQAAIPDPTTALQKKEEVKLPVQDQAAMTAITGKPQDKIAAKANSEYDKKILHQDPVGQTKFFKQASASATKNDLRTRLKNGEEVYLDLSGIVILHPFLPPFFANLGLTDQNKFVNEDSLHRAVYILGYLAMGKKEIQEQYLVLSKLLCGMQPEEPLRNMDLITPLEDEETEKLLYTVIGYWTALKTTSPDGLRNTFLNRKGKLGRNDNGWQLDVEHKSWDILLSKLPWGISIIKLPWMKELLFVDWH